MSRLFAATAAIGFFAGKAHADKPTLNWNFAGTLNQRGSCTGPPGAERPSCADATPGNSSTSFAANPTLNDGTIVAQPVGAYNDKDYISFSNLDDFQVTPFFNETVCYHLQYQVPGGGQSMGKFKPTIYYYFGVSLILEGGHMAFEVYYEDAAANGKTGSVDGNECTVYRFDCAAHPDYDPNCEFYDFCVTDDGHLLELNTSSTMGTADPNKKLHISTSIQVNDFTANPPASTFDVPVDKSECLDLKSQDFNSLPPATARAHSLETQVNDPERLRVLNEEASSLGWVAARSEFFDNWTIANTSVLTQADWRFGPLAYPDHYDVEGGSNATIPASFDARTEWKSCSSISAIRNQGACGSCWAFAAMESLADRYCVADSTKYADLTLSAQYAMGCDTISHGCNGGYIDQIWEFLQDNGTTTETCDKYKHCQDPSQIDCGGPSPPPAPGSMDACDTTCSDGHAIGPADMYSAESAYAVAKPGDVEGIQNEIMQHGPVEVGFYVFSDFQSYNSGVYKRTASAQGPTGKHAVKIVGWGSDGGDDYWIVANSWSPAWGEDGFFRIARGTNECGIEMVPAAGLPKL